jgi:hypothetical protein
LVLVKNAGDLVAASQGLQRMVVVGRHADVGVLSCGVSSAVTQNGSVVDLCGMDDRVAADRVSIRPRRCTRSAMTRACSSRALVGIAPLRGGVTPPMR